MLNFVDRDAPRKYAWLGHDGGQGGGEIRATGRAQMIRVMGKGKFFCFFAAAPVAIVSFSEKLGNRLEMKVRSPVDFSPPPPIEVDVIPPW